MQTLLIVDDEVLIAEGLHAMLSEAFAGRLQVLRRKSPGNRPSGADPYSADGY